MNVSEILRRKGTRVETTRPETTVSDAAELLTEKGIGSVVVCDTEGNVVGILTERDIVRGICKYGLALLELPVGSLMDRTVSCAPADDVKHVMSVMTTRRVRHVPVMLGEELRGMVSIGDVVKHRLQEMELEVNVLRDYARIHGASRWL